MFVTVTNLWFVTRCVGSGYVTPSFTFDLAVWPSSSRPASATPEASPSSCLVVTCSSTHNAPFCCRHRYLGASGLEKHPAKRGHTWYFNRFSSSQVLRAHLPLSSGKPSAAALLVDFVRIKIKGIKGKSKSRVGLPLTEEQNKNILIMFVCLWR